MEHISSVSNELCYLNLALYQSEYHLVRISLEKIFDVLLHFALRSMNGIKGIELFKNDEKSGQSTLSSG